MRQLARRPVGLVAMISIAGAACAQSDYSWDGLYAGLNAGGASNTTWRVGGARLYAALKFAPRRRWPTLLTLASLRRICTRLPRPSLSKSRCRLAGGAPIAACDGSNRLKFAAKASAFVHAAKEMRCPSMR